MASCKRMLMNRSFPFIWISSVIWIIHWSAAEPALDERLLPRFLDNVPNITRTIGRDALLACNVDQLKGYKVAWVQVDTQTILTIYKQVITRNPRITLLHDDHRSWHLQIKNLQENDRGWYMCQVNTDPMRSIKGYLDVVVPPDIIDRESSGDMIVLEGDDVTLRCKAKGHPTPSIVWRREDNQPIVLDNDKPGSLNNDLRTIEPQPPNAASILNAVAKVEGEILTMRKVSRLQMGSYLCIASNNVPPSISKRIHLKVHFPPVAWVPQQLEGAYVGQELTIMCHTEAFPMSINYWTNHKKEMITSGDNYESILEKSSYKVYMKLRIKRVSKNDFGNFQCIAKNSLGETDGAIKVYEMEPPPTFKTNIIDIFNNSVNAINIASTPRYKSNKESKKNGALRKGTRPNDILDPNLIRKQNDKDLNHENQNRRPTYFLGLPNASPPPRRAPTTTTLLCSIIILSNVVLQAFFI